MKLPSVMKKAAVSGGLFHGVAVIDEAWHSIVRHRWCAVLAMGASPMAPWRKKGGLAGGMSKF
ncbi:hypothetical protein G7Y82_19110 [Solimonas sp. C16B3]|uniref:Uncharacterized protein n=1 Tax=Solimonas marina TaxID=2714601 RepID=A0A970B869_9GAMM|nr:hypothetical protein [Solimonas marina]